jgi:hypothetical protein
VIDQWSWRHTAERTVEQYRILLEAHARSAGASATHRRIA